MSKIDKQLSNLEHQEELKQLAPENNEDLLELIKHQKLNDK